MRPRKGPLDTETWLLFTVFSFPNGLKRLQLQVRLQNPRYFLCHFTQTPTAALALLPLSIFASLSFFSLNHISTNLTFPFSWGLSSQTGRPLLSCWNTRHSFSFFFLFNQHTADAGNKSTNS